MVTRTRTRRVGIAGAVVEVVVGGGGDEAEGFCGGGTADGDEDLVGGEAEVGIGELGGGELAEWGREIGGRGFGRHYWWRNWWLNWRRSHLSLGVAQRQVSEEMSHCRERERERRK